MARPPITAQDMANGSSRKNYISEAELHSRIVENIEHFARCLDMPPISLCQSEKMLMGNNRSNSRARIDILLTHEDGSFSVIEVKRPDTIYSEMQGIAQLMLYNRILRNIHGDDAVIRLIYATDGGLYDVIKQTCDDYSLDIRFVFCDKDGFCA